MLVIERAESPVASARSCAVSGFGRAASAEVMRATVAPLGIRDPK